MCSALCVRHVQTLFKDARPAGQASQATGTCSWQVYKFERLQPLSYYASAEQRSSPAGAGLFWRADPGQEALVARCRMLRCAQPPVWGCNTGDVPGLATQLAGRRGYVLGRRHWSGGPGRKLPRAQVRAMPLSGFLCTPELRRAPGHSRSTSVRVTDGLAAH